MHRPIQYIKPHRSKGGNGDALDFENMMINGDYFACYFRMLSLNRLAY